MKLRGLLIVLALLVVVAFAGWFGSFKGRPYEIWRPGHSRSFRGDRQDLRAGDLIRGAETDGKLELVLEQPKWMPPKGETPGLLVLTVTTLNEPLESLQMVVPPLSPPPPCMPDLPFKEKNCHVPALKMHKGNHPQRCGIGCVEFDEAPPSQPKLACDYTGVINGIWAGDVYPPACPETPMHCFTTKSGQPMCATP